MQFIKTGNFENLIVLDDIFFSSLDIFFKHKQAGLELHYVSTLLFSVAAFQN